MSRTFTIAWREFVTTVRRPSYIIATLGTPLFFLIIGGIATIPSLVAVRRELAEQKFVSVVDESGLLTPEVLATEGIGDEEGGDAVEELMSRVTKGKRGRPLSEIKRYESREAAERDLRAEEIKSFYLVPKDYVERGELEYRSLKRRFLWDPAGGGSPLRPWLVEGLLVGKADMSQRRRARRPVSGVRSFVLGPSGGFEEETPEKTLSQIAVPFTFAFILMLSIFIASGYLIQGLVEERSTRVIELLLSSATPDELIAGKLIGLGSAGLVQLTAWVSVSIAPAVAFTPIEVSGQVVLLSAAYYVIGFVFFGSIMAGLGCVAGGSQESQQFASLWSVVAVLPMLFSPLILEAPNAVLSRVLSYIPFTCPITMIMRCASAEVAWWDILLSLLVMVVSTYAALRVSARLFRVGMLLRGQRPSLGELVTCLRTAR
ncbi:ABC transporter permease [Planctomycetota bacterium]